jgi:hypothetical protein
LIKISLKHPVVALDIEIRLSKWDTGWMHRMYMSNIELLGVLTSWWNNFKAYLLPFTGTCGELLSISTSQVSTFYLYDLLLVYLFDTLNIDETFTKSYFNIQGYHRMFQ